MKNLPKLLSIVYAAGWAEMSADFSGKKGSRVYHLESYCVNFQTDLEVSGISTLGTVIQSPTPVTFDE